MINFAPLEYFMDHMLRGRSPGSAVEVYLKGERVYQHTCGYADWENKILLTGNELYNIYSCSKIATVTAAMQLVGNAFIYNLDQKTLAKMTAELEERHAK